MRYRLLKRPSFLDYRDGRVIFYYHRDFGDAWVFSAVRAEPPNTRLLIFTAGSQAEFERSLVDGFTPNGTGDGLMRSLVARGFAEQVE